MLNFSVIGKFSWVLIVFYCILAKRKNQDFDNNKNYYTFDILVLLYLRQG